MSMGGFGSGGFFGGGGSSGGGTYGPSGPYGAWPTCGCSSIFIILAGVLLVCGGMLRLFGN